jgi:hypothetical protein
VPRPIAAVMVVFSVEIVGEEAEEEALHGAAIRATDR